MSVDANFAIVTLGVRDLARSIDFYTALGWERRGNPHDGIVWFRTSGCWVGLFGFDALAEDAALEAPGGLPAYRGITLALNLRSESEVDDAFDVFCEAGASVVKAAEHMSWGGYSGYVADPDGHLWELAHNPNFPIDAEGRSDIP
jgi:catechol 2,3-dioxygenase-like lactoylglutathione lyase family enzyme